MKTNNKISHAGLWLCEFRPESLEPALSLAVERVRVGELVKGLEALGGAEGLVEVARVGLRARLCYPKLDMTQLGDSSETRLV